MNLKKDYLNDIEHTNNTHMIALEIDHLINFIVNHKFRLVLEEAKK